MAGDDTGSGAVAVDVLLLLLLLLLLFAAAEPVEWITFGFTFCMFGSGGEEMTAAGAVCELMSVRA